MTGKELTRLIKKYGLDDSLIFMNAPYNMLIFADDGDITTGIVLHTGQVIKTSFEAEEES